MTFTTESYALVGQVLHVAAVVGGLVWGVWRLTRHEELIRHFASPQYRAVWATLLALTVGSMAAGGVAVASESLSSDRFLGILVIFSLVSLAITACVYPAAADTDKPIRPIEFNRRSLLPYAWALLTLTWSFASIFIVVAAVGLATGQDVELKELEEGMVQLFDPGKPIAFLAFSLFGVAAAFHEEILFRGAIQGALMRTPLGAPVAIAITALLFTAGHMGAYVEPWGPKEVQIFGLGMIFGIVRHHYGLRPAILLHVINNSVALLLHSTKVFLGE